MTGKYRKEQNSSTQNKTHQMFFVVSAGVLLFSSLKLFSQSMWDVKPVCTLMCWHVPTKSVSPTFWLYGVNLIWLSNSPVARNRRVKDRRSQRYCQSYLVSCLIMRCFTFPSKKSNSSAVICSSSLNPVLSCISLFGGHNNTVSV